MNEKSLRSAALDLKILPNQRKVFTRLNATNNYANQFRRRSD